MSETAKRSFVAAVVVVAVVATALALWKLKLIVALVFVAMTWAAAMRPGVDWLRRHGDQLGIVVRLSEGQVRYSAQAINRHIAACCCSPLGVDPKHRNV